MSAGVIFAEQWRRVFETTPRLKRLHIHMAPSSSAEPRR
jgi:hypothetical protein